MCIIPLQRDVSRRPRTPVCEDVQTEILKSRRLTNATETTRLTEESIGSYSQRRSVHLIRSRFSFPLYRDTVYQPVDLATKERLGDQPTKLAMAASHSRSLTRGIDRATGDMAVFTRPDQTRPAYDFRMAYSMARFLRVSDATRERTLNGRALFNR